MIQAQGAGQLVPYLSATFCCTLICRPGVKGLRRSRGWEMKEDTATPKRHPVHVYRTRRHFVTSGRHKGLPSPSLHTWWWKQEKTHRPEDIQTVGCSPWRHLCRIPSRPWSALRHSGWWFWEPSSWWGSPRRQQRQINLQIHQFPWNTPLAKLNFKPRAAIFHSPSLEKSVKPHWVRKPKLVFCCFSWSTRGTSPEFQMCGSWMEVGVQASAQQLQKGDHREVLKTTADNLLSLFLSEPLDLLVWKERGEKKKKLALIVLFSQFSCQLTHDKRMSFSINFNSAEQKNREFIGNYWKQRNHLFF